MRAVSSLLPRLLALARVVLQHPLEHQQHSLSATLTLPGSHNAITWSIPYRTSAIIVTSKPVRNRTALHAVFTTGFLSKAIIAGRSIANIQIARGRRTSAT